MHMKSTLVVEAAGFATRYAEEIAQAMSKAIYKKALQRRTKNPYLGI